jgi:hypothetical protein
LALPVNEAQTGSTPRTGKAVLFFAVFSRLASELAGMPGFFTGNVRFFFAGSFRMVLFGIGVGSRFVLAGFVLVFV